MSGGGPQEIQLLDFGNGVTIPADWVTVIPGDPPVVVLRPLVLGVVKAAGTGEEGKGEQTTA